MLNVTLWKEFQIKDLFTCCLSKGDLKADDCLDGDLPLISSGSNNNGIVKYIDKNGDGKAKIFDGNCLTVDMFCKCFYQKNDFYSVSHGRVNILVPKYKFNEYIGLFLVTVIDLQKFKYSYGRAVYSDVVKNMVIRLPVNKDNLPDWEYMEEYIKSIEDNEKIRGKKLLKIN